MEYLWAPWRGKYMEEKATGYSCIFCAAAQHPDNDERTFVVHRGRYCFVMLNRYPYTSGHLMIVPYEHVAKLEEATQESTGELMLLARQAEQVLNSIYKPDGFNLGMNLGVAAGAGIAEHLHLHFLPRWTGDANFMTTVGDSRVIPEALQDTFHKVNLGFAASTKPR